LNCLEARTGKKLWSHDTLAEAKAANTEWGMAASPLVYDNVVVVNPGGPEGNGVVAYDRVSGEKVWSGGSDKASYASPELRVVDGVRQVLIFDAVGIAGHSPEDGAQLWKFPWTNAPTVNAAQPIVLGDPAHSQVFIGNGYSVGSAVLGVSHDAEGWRTAAVWQSRQLKLKFNAAVARDGYVYGLDEIILACLSTADGKRQWRGGRFGYGQLLLVGDRILILAESGEVVLVEANPKEFHELARFPAIEGKTWNHPVLCRDHLYVRNAEQAACYDLSAKSSVSSAEVPSTQ
jgi:outer membrane protein assembly factor BamB